MQLLDKYYSDHLTESTVATEVFQQDTHREFVYSDKVDFLSNAIRILSDQWTLRILRFARDCIYINDSERAGNLWSASSRGHAAVVAFLILDHPVQINGVAKSGNVPLCAAVEGGHESTVRILIDKGADTAMQGRFGTRRGNIGNALHAAAHKGHTGTTRLLLETPPELIENRYKYANTPLSIALSTGKVSMVRLLVHKGAHIGARDPTDKNAVQKAMERNRVEMTRFLLDNRPDLVDSKTAGGHTLLHMAAFLGYEEATEMLTRYGADVNAQDREFCSVLQQASDRFSKKTVQLLLEKHANVNAQGGLHSSAL